MATDNHHTIELRKQAELRRQIIEIHQNESLCLKKKATRIQQLMSHSASTSLSPGHRAHEHCGSALNEYERSYHDKEKNILGCPHYRRNVKLQAACCQKIFPCRLCHDANSDHFIIRSETKNMLCMECQTLQPVGQWCKACGTKAAQYYCNKCQFWNDDREKPTYHCDSCGICRQGKGIGIDFHHCTKCNVCMAISVKNTHKCIERNLESDCPICGEYMFTSTTAVIVMPCGHGIHKPCYKKLVQSSYRCPICLKSLNDMSFYFRQLERELECQPMPEAYKYHTSVIFCNDCEKKSDAPYHFFHHRCQICSSFNTTVLKTKILDTVPPPLSSS